MVNLAFHKSFSSPPRISLEFFARNVLRALGKPRNDISIVFMSDREMRRFNRRYLKRDRPTDVLAFPPAGASEGGKSGFLGDILISVDRAKVYAARFGNTFREELELYIVHGILHLLGYRDYTLKEKKRMRRKEEEILLHARQLGIGKHGAR